VCGIACGACGGGAAAAPAHLHRRLTIRVRNQRSRKARLHIRRTLDWHKALIQTGLVLLGRRSKLEVIHLASLWVHTPTKRSLSRHLIRHVQPYDRIEAGHMRRLQHTYTEWHSSAVCQRVALQSA